MKCIERFADLMDFTSLDVWRSRVFALGEELGYEQTMLAILPNRNTPVESEFSFQHSNYSPIWLNRYDDEKMGYIDPTVAHTMTKSTPLIWSSEVFREGRQTEMYEEARSHGIRSGVTFPIHGVYGELGILNCVSDTALATNSYRHFESTLPELSCLRDFIFESSIKFMKGILPQRNGANITNRELECLKWAAAGKSSWEMGQILNCSEATVNFHFCNIRRKLDSQSRQHAVVKAIRLGLISPA